MSHFSNSQLTEYARCGKAYQLRRKQQAPSTYSWWLLGGSAVHSAIEEYNLSLAGFADNISDFRMFWSKTFARAYAEAIVDYPDVDEWRTAGRANSLQTYDWWHENGLDMVMSWVRFVEENRWTPAVFNGEPAVEFDVTCKFGWGENQYQIKGFVDLVAEQPDGTLVMVDFKTGSRAVSTFQQMGLYVCAMQRLGLPRPTLAGYFMNRKGTFGSFASLAQYTPEYFDDLFDSLGQGIEAGVFLPSLGDHCRICDVADACFANGGSRSALYDPHDPRFVDRNMATNP